jgi:hypothetical protein
MDWWKDTQYMTMLQIKQQARRYLDEKDAKLLCTNFKGCVAVIHQDGSGFDFENAIMEEKQFGNFKLLLVWTEHCDSFFFFTEDLESWYYTPYENTETQERPEGTGDAEERTDDH